MADSRPASPDAPPQDLWSSILDSVSSSRIIPAKQILILGEPKSGKSTLATAILGKSSSQEGAHDEVLDFAVGYDWADVRDEGDEGESLFHEGLSLHAWLYHGVDLHTPLSLDTLARLSVYTIPSSVPTYSALLPHFLPPRSTLPHTVVIIVLDWTKPWTFVEELQTWLKWIDIWSKGEESRDLDILREENRERCEMPKENRPRQHRPLTES
jgi:dynein light intermediate chain 1, cytosolic